jgi:hypothetical protein
MLVNHIPSKWCLNPHDSHPSTPIFLTNTTYTQIIVCFVYPAYPHYIPITRPHKLVGIWGFVPKHISIMLSSIGNHPFAKANIIYNK